MDLPSTNMYDIYKDGICKELGPLDPDWFEALTAQTFSNEGNVSDQDELCANQEGHFKPPLDRGATESQLFSTPKVFRHTRVRSPETEDDQSFVGEKEPSPWTTTQSPYLFQISKDGVPAAKYGGLQPQSQDSFDLLHTPRKTPVSHKKRISESLGAQHNPDMSWTSSLCTPPAESSTLILSKKDESPCPASISSNNNVVFVRKLFPSLSNTSAGVGTVSPKHDDIPTIHHGVVCPEAAENPETHNSSQNSLNESGVWKQTLPDAIEDGEIRKTVASVLDGAENVLSIFFTNSSSALRKVKTDRIKRKQIVPTKEPDLSTDNAASSEQKTADQDPVGPPTTPPVKTADSGITQWSPLSLSEIPPSAVDTCRVTQVENLTEQQQSGSDSGQPVTKTPIIIHSKKKRRFIYDVSHLQAKESQSQKIDSSLWTPDAGPEVNVKQKEEVGECSIGRSNGVQDLDMSQLCKDFAQDFSQMSDVCKLSDVIVSPRKDFSPSACLSAMKQAKQKAMLAKRHCDSDGVVSATNECTLSDSGFQSNVADGTHVTASLYVPSSGINGQQSGFKTDTPRSKGAEAKLSSVIKENQILDPLRGREFHTENTSARLPSRAKGSVDNINTDYIPLHGGQPEKTVPLPSLHAQGFKTASNKGIHITSANLERAKQLFEETEGETLSDKTTQCARDTATSHDTVKNPTANSHQSENNLDISCQLTASQRADVTELCTLLEEADTQFEFTQFKTAKPKPPSQQDVASPQKAELNPDFLSGIDFNDSFSSVAEKQIPDRTALISEGETSKSTDLSLSTVTVSSSSELVPAGQSSIMSAVDKNIDAARKSETSKQENQNPLPLGVGFKTAGGNTVRVSKKCLSKARALFADLEKSEKSQDGPSREMDPNSSCWHPKGDNPLFTGRGNNTEVTGDEDAAKNWKMDTTGPQRGFQMASGKVVSLSAKALQEADTFFKDCDAVDISVMHKKSVEALPGGVGHKETPKNEQINEFGDVNDGRAECHADVVQHNLKIHHFGSKNTPALINAASFRETAKSLSSPSNTTSKATGFSAINQFSSGGGFCTASGNKVTMSMDSLRKAELLLNEAHTPEDKQLTEKGDVVRAGHLPKNGGFHTASGKGVAISSTALKKAKMLFSECDEDQISVKQTHLKIPGPTSGFLAASGKKVGSAEAIQKAKALFSDISAEIPVSSHSRKQGDAEMGKINCGFTTAGGAKVHVSQKNLLKAKNLLADFDEKAMQEADSFFKDMDSSDGMSTKHNVTTEAVMKSLPEVNQDNKVTESGSGHKGSDKNHKDMLRPDDVEDRSGVSNAAFSHGNPSLIRTPSSPPLCTTSNSISSSPVHELSKRAGFSTASGGKVSVSDYAMAKAKSVLNGGFLTASGKGVSISPAALKKAKTLFSECDQVEDVKPGPTSRNSGFLAASGKKVGLSAEAIQKAKALFSDISAEIPVSSHTRKQGDAETGKINCGFTTAGGAKVHVSQRNLLKARSLLADVECHDSNASSTSPHDQADPSKCVKRTTTSDKDVMAATYLTALQESEQENGCVSTKDKAPVNPPAGVSDLLDSPGAEMSHLLDCDISGSERFEVTRPDKSSHLNFQSLNLSGCTETQQELFAQEALDCTKALLEDESLSMTLGNEYQQEKPESSVRSVAEPRWAGKRSVVDPDVTGQPPLKRRLLEEFDRTVAGPSGSALHPEKSSPDDVMKDRRIFKYSVSLQPNITRPNRSGKSFVDPRLQKTATTQLSTPGESRSTHSKTPAFVAPFFKNVTSESRKNPERNVRTPPTFVPPFKKQRVMVQEGSSKPQEEKDKHVFVTPYKSNTSTCTPDVTGNKGKEEVQTAILTDDLTNQSLPAGCGSADPAAEDVDPLSGNQGIFHNVELARDMQDMRIRKKKRQTIRPLPGTLFLAKTSGVRRTPLKAAVDRKPPAKCTQTQLYRLGVHQHVCEISSQTAESFRFHLQHFIKQEALIDGGGVQLADGGWLIPSNDGTAGKEEFHRALCDTPGVDPKLISEAWVSNHYRWIVWKQASMERSFPEAMGGLCLTPEQVLLQLKYRYDVEVDHSRRPALRKIMEKDDTAAKTLVLCVSGVVSRGHSPNRRCSVGDGKTPRGADAAVENPSAVVQLTDGWYAIKAQLDEPLTAMLHKGRVAVGGKLIVHGAQLVGSQDACSPLEAPESLMLKICANSSRPARWDTKLGFHKDPRPFLLPVSSLYSSGGPVGCVDIIILRTYPIQWMERKPDGGVVFRSARAEEKEARRYNSHKQKSMEALFTKIQAEFEKEDKGKEKPQRRRRTISRQDIASLQDGEELYEAVGDDLEAHLSEQQFETLRSYRRSLMERKQAELQDRYRRALENAEDSEGSVPKRDVTSVWRLCVSDSTDKPGTVYQLSLWRPSSDLQSLLKEGCRYKVYNLTTSDGKKHGSSSSIQLTGTKRTQFQDLQAPQEWLSTRFQPRISTYFADLQNPEFQSLCGEVDLAGYIISIIDGHGFSPAFYLADGNLNFVKVRCFSSFAQSGLEDLVKPRVLLALSNLQLRGQSMSPTPVVYAGDLTVFSTNPKEAHLQEALSQHRNLIQSQENFFPVAEEKLSHLLHSDGPRSISTPTLQTRTSALTPIRSVEFLTPVSRKHPAANSSSEKDPRSLKRRRALDYLSRIPSPPPLCHVGSMASPSVKLTFNPPRRSGTPSTLNTPPTPACKAVTLPVDDEWVNDEELAMIDTQALRVGEHKTV